MSGPSGTHLPVSWILYLRSCCHQPVHPVHSTRPGTRPAIGRCILGSRFFSYLESVRPLEGEWDDAHALRALYKEKKVMGKILEGTGFDVGNPIGYRAAEKFVSE